MRKLINGAEMGINIRIPSDQKDAVRELEAEEGRNFWILKRITASPDSYEFEIAVKSAELEAFREKIANLGFEEMDEEEARKSA